MSQHAPMARVASTLALGVVAVAAACERRSALDAPAGPSASAAPMTRAVAATPAATHEPTILAPAAVAVASPCPDGMALIGEKFCIDKWEAATENPDGTLHSPYHRVKATPVKAVSRAGVVPQAYIGEEQAEAACGRAGKTLCTTEEWMTACSGAKGPKRPYPYGMQRQKALCNTERTLHPTVPVFGTPRFDALSLNSPLLNQQPDTLARTGEFAGCVTPEGVHDLYGNLLEWTRGAKPRPFMMGGHYLDGVKHGLGCAYVTDGHGDQYSDFTTGFRCCAKPDPGKLASFVAEHAEARLAAYRPPAPPKDGSSRDPEGMRSFENARGRLPEVAPPAYEPADAACPIDMVRVQGGRCPDVVERCLEWLPHRQAGQLTSCARFAEPTVCRSAARTPMDYCIDRYEFTPEGYDYPLTHVNWTEAGLLCSRMGKRLCVEEEWEFACEGEEAVPYPYGYTRDAERCHHDIPELELVRARDDFIDHRVKRDALPGCVSPFGVYNLVGNVDEWTTRPGGQPYPSILRGGWWFMGRNRCRAATSNHSQLYAGVQTGFRCCKASRGK
ncbi:MAG: SUMF1/EgtB/PvdO family nonheme iron enzyme [Sorangiineae bacterium]|nr:SUMF1/EgtB/PvdO family nonheme iron enzyme [Polyangiaceae bacterium]MEB2324311.1 SUMF1/EgtB/PvdO family nonheme iron enzyme [Sorangiineae bacterium]